MEILETILNFSACVVFVFLGGGGCYGGWELGNILSFFLVKTFFLDS